MLELILKPWPWYISGPMISLVLLLLLWSGKTFGMSANLRTMCAAMGAGKRYDFFDFNWKDQIWNLLVVVGAIGGGFIAAQYLSLGTAMDLNPQTITQLQQYGIQDAGTAFMPEALFGSDNWNDPKVLGLLIVGGFFVGFGTRYAGGCTSGHAITGLSNLQLPSLIAVVGFFIGGLFINHLILPLLL